VIEIAPESVPEKIARLLAEYYETHGYPPLLLVVSEEEVIIEGYELEE
jgi:hypothetical protein